MLVPIVPGPAQGQSHHNASNPKTDRCIEHGRRPIDLSRNGDHRSVGSISFGIVTLHILDSDRFDDLPRFRKPGGLTSDHTATVSVGSSPVASGHLRPTSVLASKPAARRQLVFGQMGTTNDVSIQFKRSTQRIGGIVAPYDANADDTPDE